MELKDEIMHILSEHGIKEAAEDYDWKISRVDMVSELITKGFDKEAIDEALEQLCVNGTLAMDEQNVYQYDNPV